MGYVWGSRRLFLGGRGLVGSMIGLVDRWSTAGWAAWAVLCCPAESARLSAGQTDAQKDISLLEPRFGPSGRYSEGGLGGTSRDVAGRVARQPRGERRTRAHSPSSGLSALLVLLEGISARLARRLFIRCANRTHRKTFQNHAQGANVSPRPSGSVLSPSKTSSSVKSADKRGPRPRRRPQRLNSSSPPACLSARRSPSEEMALSALSREAARRRPRPRPPTTPPRRRAARAATRTTRTRRGYRAKAAADDARGRSSDAAERGEEYGSRRPATTPSGSRPSAPCSRSCCRRASRRRSTPTRRTAIAGRPGTSRRHRRAENVRAPVSQGQRHAGEDFSASFVAIRRCRARAATRPSPATGPSRERRGRATRPRCRRLRKPNPRSPCRPRHAGTSLSSPAGRRRRRRGARVAPVSARQPARIIAAGCPLDFALYAAAPACTVPPRRQGPRARGRRWWR